MFPAKAAMSRRTFLSISSVASAAIVLPACATTFGDPGPLALASRRSAVPVAWSGAVVVLSGDYSQRLSAVREAIANSTGRPVSLFLDDADAVLFDIATIDQRPHLRPRLLPHFDPVRATASPARLSRGVSA